MSDTIDLFIDLNAAGLAEDAALARAKDVPEGSKAGEAGFDLGILQAEVNLKNILALMGWLRERIAGSTLKIEYGDVTLEYRTEAQLEQQIQALKVISPLTVRVVKSDSSEA
ncbi:hypothetical protein [Vacuolonema iberomarrocanum]|uniref:hypothetical protein n=1 Tax=Vacuolonema iberomarrocanum TaxID=3454632 RepID=UPI001A0E4FEB|nr:hypothetical protein [filamentous cyanobacterium LEGE 07170]